MENTIFTLQDFMLKTENTTYIILAVTLIALLGFWHFLTERDGE